MIKATDGLPAALADFKALTRRAFFRFGAAATALTVPALLPAVATPAPALRAAPTRRGRELLRAVKSRRDTVNSFVVIGEDIPDDAHEGHGVEEAMAAIKASPVRTIGDVVDQLVALGERLEPGCNYEYEELAPHFNAVLRRARRPDAGRLHALRLRSGLTVHEARRRPWRELGPLSFPASTLALWHAA